MEIHYKELHNFDTFFYKFCEKSISFKCEVNNSQRIRDLIDIVNYLNDKNIKYKILENEDIKIINS